MPKRDADLLIEDIIVWEVIQTDLPQLKSQLATLGTGV